MAINLTLFPTEAPAVVYFEDGTSVSVDPQQERGIQIPSGSFCTISSTAGSEEGDEHPPPGPGAFAEAMVKFWQGLADKAREARAEATPY